MIVQPNFLDHWKTNALAAKIGRLEALTALLSLWSHCQNQRTWQFPHNELMLAGICRYTGNPRVLIDTLLELNLLEKTSENDIEVHQWAETNAKLLHNWKVGKKGGRPTKQPKDEPLENPRVNPTQTQGEPKGEPIREDKIREENTPLIPQGGTPSNFAAGVSSSETLALSAQDDKSEAIPKKKKKGGGRLTSPVFPVDLPPAYHQPLSSWFAYKCQMGKGYVEDGWAALVSRERKFSAAQVAASVESSMANNYTGLFTSDLIAKFGVSPLRQATPSPVTQAHWQVKQQAMEDELATLKFTPARQDPEWPWKRIGKELFDYEWPTAADIPADNWTAIERHYALNATAYTLA